MKKELLIKGEALQASVASALAAEQFLNDHYLIRRNKLNGKVEFSIKPAEGQEPVFRPLTQEALNSIILRAKREETMWPSCSAACLESAQNSRIFSASGCDLVWLIGCRWTPCTAMRLCLRSLELRAAERPPSSSVCCLRICANISWTT